MLSSFVRERPRFVKVLRILQQQLLKLQEEGVWFSPLQCYLPVRTNFIISDNAGAHMILGLEQNFNDGHICRSCYATYDDIQDPLADNFRKRTAASYRNDARSKSGGVRESPLLNFGNQEIFGLLPQDPGHDIFEGEGKTVIARLLYYLCRCCSVPLGTIHQCIRNFKLGLLNRGVRLDVMDKQTVNKNSLRLHGKMDTVYMLIRFIPIILGHLFESDDPFWQMFLEFRSAVLLIKCWCHTEDTLRALDMHLKAYAQYVDRLVRSRLRNTYTKPRPHQSFERLKNQEYQFWHDIAQTVKPKYHFVVCHMVDTIKAFGPTCEFDTIRPEALHHVLIEKQNLAKNVRNVPLTMTRRYQEESVVRIYSSDFLKGVLKFSAVDANELPAFVNNQQLIMRVLGNACAHSQVTLYCEIGGLKYKAAKNERDLEMFVFISSTSDNVAVFGKILLILVVEENVFLLVEAHSTRYNYHYGCFVVRDSRRNDLLAVSSLEHPMPLHGFRHVSLGECIVPRYQIG